jgi:hypothetical protein
MKQGKGHREACFEVANKVGVTPSTISDQCSRSLGLSSVDEFRKLYETGKVEGFLKKKYPGDFQAIAEVFLDKSILYLTYLYFLEKRGDRFIFVQ